METVGRRASFTDVAHLSHHGSSNSIVDIRIREHDEGRVAAELHRDPEQVLGGLLHELAPDLRRTGKGQLAQTTIREEGRDH